jgi:ring-1,2-phenylacetyl-CoA epoxidase subunit PaaE
MTFYKLKIQDIRTETADCISISFDIPNDLKPQFAYKAGQYLTLRTFIEDEDVRRSYSLCSSPLENEWRIAIKKVENGVFSTFAHTQLHTGDELEVMPSMGHFTLPTVETLHCNVSTPARYVFIAAGSGITPILSILKTVLKNDPLSNCTLIYGNRNTSSIIFREEIEGLKNKYLNRFQIFHVLSRQHTDSELGSGRLDKAKIQFFTNLSLRGTKQSAKIMSKDLFLEKRINFYICGPYDMIQDAKSVLIENNIPSKNIHFELFNAPKTRNSEKKPVDLSKNHIVSIKLDGSNFDVSTPEGMSILDAAQMMGADLPFACKGGVCCTCRAKLLEGKVEMDVNYALTEEEIEVGFILTCQAVPKSERLVVSFDVK